MLESGSEWFFPLFLIKNVLNWEEEENMSHKVQGGEGLGG